MAVSDECAVFSPCRTAYSQFGQKLVIQQGSSRRVEARGVWTFVDNDYVYIIDNKHIFVPCFLSARRRISLFPFLIGDATRDGVVTARAMRTRRVASVSKQFC